VQEFGKFGSLESVKIVLDSKSGQSRCFGFITFEDVKDATKAKNALTETGQQHIQRDGRSPEPVGSITTLFTFMDLEQKLFNSHPDLTPDPNHAFCPTIL